jgi:hypothetical protein
VSVIVIPLTHRPGAQAPYEVRPEPLGCSLVPGTRDELTFRWMNWYANRGPGLNLTQVRDRTTDSVVHSVYQAVHHRVHAVESPDVCSHGTTYRAKIKLDTPLWPPRAGWVGAVSRWSGDLCKTVEGFQPVQDSNGDVDYDHLECYELFLLVELFHAGELL